MLGDTEFISGSKVGKSSIYHIDFTEQGTFDNKMRIKTSETAGTRDLGTTLQIFSTASMSNGILLDDKFRYPQNHVTTFGGNSHFMLNRGYYTGYKYNGSGLGFACSPSPAIQLTWTQGGIIPVENLATGQVGISFEDLSTASFYTIKVEHQNRLKIVRDDSQGTVN